MEPVLYTNNRGILGTYLPKFNMILLNSSLKENSRLHDYVLNHEHMHAKWLKKTRFNIWIAALVQIFVDIHETVTRSNDMIYIIDKWNFDIGFDKSQIIGMDIMDIVSENENMAKPHMSFDRCDKLLIGYKLLEWIPASINKLRTHLSYNRN